MVNTKIVNTLIKSQKKSNAIKFDIKKNWAKSKVMKSQHVRSVIARANKKIAKITELPINGYLTIDDEPLSINQVILLKDISRLKFNIENGLQSSNYGSFKLFVFHGNVTEEEFYFKLDTDVINSDPNINDNHKNISLPIEKKQQNNNNGDEEAKSGFKLKDEKLEKELLDFIAKRESGVVFDKSNNCWVEATKSIFEEDIFDTEKVKSEAR